MMACCSTEQVYNLNLILCQYDIRLEIICTGTSETPTQICLHVFFC